MSRAILSAAYYDAGYGPSADRGRVADPFTEPAGQTETCHLDSSGCSDIGSCRVCAACARIAPTPTTTPTPTPTGGCRPRARHPHSTPRATHSSTSHQSLALALLLFWSLVLSAKTSPVKRSLQANPCNLGAPAAAAGGAGTSEAKLLDQIILVTDVIRPKLDQLMDKFLELTFPSKDEAEMLRDWGQHNVSWLGFVRETIAAQELQLSALSAAGALPTLFTDLQRLGLGLEEARITATLTGHETQKIFHALHDDVRQLLCEVHLAMLEKQLEPTSTSTPSKDSTDLPTARERDLRNWVLVREYKAYIGHAQKLLNALRERSED